LKFDAERFIFFFAEGLGVFGIKYGSENFYKLLFRDLVFSLVNSEFLVQIGKDGLVFTNFFKGCHCVVPGPL